MALTGVHIACAFAGGSGKRGLTLPVLRKPSWSQTMATAGTTTLAAPQEAQEQGEPLFCVSTSSADIFVAIDPAPNATTGARLYVPANSTEHIYCSPGDKLAWVAA